VLATSFWWVTVVVTSELWVVVEWPKFITTPAVAAPHVPIVIAIVVTDKVVLIAANPIGVLTFQAGSVRRSPGSRSQQNTVAIAAKHQCVGHSFTRGDADYHDLCVSLQGVNSREFSTF
jgi:hypothetical protein